MLASTRGRGWLRFFEWEDQPLSEFGPFFPFYRTTSPSCCRMKGTPATNVAAAVPAAAALATAAAPTAAAAPSTAAAPAFAATATATEAATHARRSRQSRSAECSLFELEEANAKVEQEMEKKAVTGRKNYRGSTKKAEYKNAEFYDDGSTTTTDSNKWKSTKNVLRASNAMKGSAADAATVAVNKAEMKKAEYYDDAVNILCSPAPKVIEGGKLLATLRESAKPALLVPSNSPNQRCNLRRVLPNISGATHNSITKTPTFFYKRPTRAHLNVERLLSLLRSPSPLAPQSSSQPLSPTEMRQPVLPRGERVAGVGRRTRTSSVCF